MIITHKASIIQLLQQVLDSDFLKKYLKRREKKSWKFVYILAKQRKSPYNLTIFFKKIK